MLPILLAADTEPTALIITGLGTAVAAMASILAAIALAKVSSLTKADKEHVDDGHKAEVDIVKLQGFAAWATSEIDSVKRGHLPREYYKLATASQNAALNAHTDALIEIKAKLDDLDRSKATRSETSIPAARPAQKRPIPRNDPPSEPPDDLPPMRAELPSSIIT